MGDQPCAVEVPTAFLSQLKPADEDRGCVLRPVLQQDLAKAARTCRAQGKEGAPGWLVFVPARLRNGEFCQAKWAYVPALQPRTAYLGKTFQHSTFPKGAGKTTKPRFAALIWAQEERFSWLFTAPTRGR